eukprot:scaffold1162_cov170-Amphora_coffeaeformis.AAC.16
MKLREDAIFKLDVETMLSFPFDFETDRRIRFARLFRDQNTVDPFRAGPSGWYRAVCVQADLTAIGNGEVFAGNNRKAKVDVDAGGLCIRQQQRLNF